jgi:hypothetical protein
MPKVRNLFKSSAKVHFNQMQLILTIICYGIKNQKQKNNQSVITIIFLVIPTVSKLNSL